MESVRVDGFHSALIYCFPKLPQLPQIAQVGYFGSHQSKRAFNPALNQGSIQASKRHGQRVI